MFIAIAAETDYYVKIKGNGENLQKHTWRECYEKKTNAQKNDPNTYSYRVTVDPSRQTDQVFVSVKGQSGNVIYAYIVLNIVTTSENAEKSNEIKTLYPKLCNIGWDATNLCILKTDEIQASSANIYLEFKCLTGEAFQKHYNLIQGDRMLSQS